MRSLVLLAVLVLAGCAPASQPPITCAGGASSDPIAVLVVGDSWGTAARLDEGLARATGLRSCSVGYSGKRAGQIAAILRSSPLPKAETIVMLVGVNDEVQHAGASTYANGVTALRREAAKASSNVLLVELPRVDLERDDGSPQRRAKRWLQRHVWDRGEKEITQKYRAAVRADIPFDPFISSYATHRGMYKGDGIHLTDAAFDQLGEYLGLSVIAEISPRQGDARLHPATQ